MKPWDYFECCNDQPETWPKVPEDMPRFDMLKFPNQDKLVIRNHYSPDPKTNKKPKIIDANSDGREIIMKTVTKAMISIGKYNENGLKAIAAGMSGESQISHKSDEIYSFTFYEGFFQDILCDQ